MIHHQVAPTHDKGALKTILSGFPIDHRQDKPSDRGAKGGGKRIVAIGRMVEAVGQAFGKLAAEPAFTKTVISVTVHADSSSGLFREQSVWEILERTARELRANVASGKPRRHTIALTDAALVPFLKSVAQNQRDGDPPPQLVDEAGKHEIPVLDMQDFDEPTDEEPRQQSDTFQVVGLHINTGNDMNLLFTNDCLAVRPDPVVEQQVLAWPCRIFRGKVWIEGTIIRDDEGVWQLTEGAKVVLGEPLVYID